MLAKTAALADLPPKARAQLARGAKEASLRTGDFLWREGDPAAHLGIVLTGRLKVTRSELWGETILDIVAPGDLLGEMALCKDAEHQSDVVCLRRARVSLVPAKTVQMAMRREPRVAEALAMSLAWKVARLYRSTQEQAGNTTVSHRLARVLLRLADEAGEPLPGGIFIPLRLRRADLAAMSGTTMESVSRKISEWRSRGWVVPQPIGYLIQDRSALLRLVDDR